VNTTLQHLAIRPSIGLLAAFVLATTATVAVAAETHAAKPVPVPTIDGVDCQLITGSTVVNADLNVEAKGRWVYVWVQYRIEGIIDIWVDELPKGSRLNRQGTKAFSGGPLSGTGIGGEFRVTMTDRDGIPLPDAEVATGAATSCQ
jgi:hypothetical protein